jgi:hypothetical protein
MQKIQLFVDRTLQGDFELQDLNLLFVFQVNCPGCFIYGFPLMNKLYWQYRERGLNILGLATAFEDFDYNTAENVKLLLAEQKTVGATYKALGERYNQPINFPIAVDVLASDHMTSLTFSQNRLPGTPTFLLIDRDLHLLEGWFGHTPEKLVLELLERHLPHEQSEILKQAQEI